MALTCKQLRMVAELRHGKLPEPVKSKASEFFEFLDVDKDGKVTLQELLASTLTEKFSQHFLENLFYSLDDEEKGYLNFTQCLAVNYMCMYSTRVCGGCDYNIPHGLGYTCFRCLKDGASGTDAKAFSVCLDCYSSRNYRHAHHAMHLLHDFMLLETLLNKWPSASAQEETEPAPIKEVQQTMKQCIICGDHHESTVRGFTCDVHMARMRNSIEFVCEWCFSYLCYRCGNLYRDSTTRAEPGKWLQRFVCPACHQKNSTTDRYESSLQAYETKHKIHDADVIGCHKSKTRS
ncbi:hypothetical protein KP509_25G012600 [Ceratopteris richardii]|uniref:EF-hand domain-containing protein n=1 Tax=Ceratopteris richardii TaxID=49495 RepID=A0A8T2RQJ5_CERRI|nr:hypothetical protein KP509_25G012600 [Ceratopteris richardii]